MSSLFSPSSKAMKVWQFKILVVLFLVVSGLSGVQGVDHNKCIDRTDSQTKLRNYSPDCLSYKTILHIVSPKAKVFTIRINKFTGYPLEDGLIAKFKFGSCDLDIKAVVRGFHSYFFINHYDEKFEFDTKVKFKETGYTILAGKANPEIVELCSPFIDVSGIYISFAQDVPTKVNLALIFDKDTRVEMVSKVPIPPPATTENTSTSTIVSSTDSISTTDVPITEAITTSEASSTNAPDSDSSSKTAPNTKASVTAETTQEPKPTVPGSIEKPKDDGKLGLIIGLSVAALIVILGGSGLIGFICFRKNKEKKAREREERIARLHRKTDDSKGTENTTNSRKTEVTEQTKGTERSKSQGSQLSKESKATEPSKDESKESKGDKAKEKLKEAKK